ncbi:MAG: TetR/AcrR family transcriptional regulator [Chloroflexota bacterium]
MTKQKSRRVPKQARSRQRYNLILQTAAELFAKSGVDQVSTNHIAAAAGVPIGSLYQFFPNKEAIIESLIEQYMQAFGEVFPQSLDTSVPIKEVIRHVLTQFVHFNRENAGFKALLIGLEGTSIANVSDEMQQAIVHNIDQVLAAYYPALAPDRRLLCATVSFSLVVGIMPVEMPPDAVVDEMVLAITAYQQAFLKREESEKRSSK